MKLSKLILEQGTPLGDLLGTIDPNLGYREFAKLVADTLKEEYGSHNIDPFMKELHKHLGLDEKVEEGYNDHIDLDDAVDILNKEQSKVKFDTSQYYGGEARGYGTEQEMADFATEWDRKMIGPFQVQYVEGDEETRSKIKLVNTTPKTFK